MPEPDDVAWPRGPHPGDRALTGRHAWAHAGDPEGGVLAALQDVTMAARFCDRLLLVEAGELVAEGPPAEVLDEPRVSRTWRDRRRDPRLARGPFRDRAPLMPAGVAWPDPDAGVRPALAAPEA